MTAFDPRCQTRSTGMYAPSPATRSTNCLALAAAGLVLAAGATLALRPSLPDPARTNGPAAGAAAAGTTALPALYVPNAGQSSPGVRFEAQGTGGAMRFRSDGVAIAGTGTVMRFAGAQPRPRIAGTGAQPGVVNVLRGDRTRWRTHLPVFSGVAYSGLYRGVDLRFAGGGMAWTVAAGADPTRIGWDYPGARDVRVRPYDGALEITLRRTAGDRRTRVEPRPMAWQRIGGRRTAVPAAYRVDAHGRVTYALGRFRRGAALVVGAAAAPAATAAAAPSPAFSTYLGGTQWDEAMDVETDSAGATYVAGFTESINAPVANAARRTQHGIMDAYVAKLAPDGRTLRYATFLGGRDLDVASALAVDRRGNAYVAGRTASEDFPVRRAQQGAIAGRQCQALPRHDTGEPCHDAFVAKLGPSGALVYSTYLGGRENEEAVGLAVDRQGRAYVTGNTDSTDFPTQRPLQRQFRSRRCASTVPCPLDAFVTKLSANGRRLVYSTYLGGIKGDAAGGIAVDRRGAAYVTGVTRSADFPTRRARQGALRGRACGPPPATACPDVFVTKLRPDGRAIVFSTYLGGRKAESSAGIAVDARGRVFVAGSTQSPDFPTVRPVQAAIGNSSCSATGPPKEQCGDAFVSSLSADGQRLRYSTYLGGNAEDTGLGIAVERTGSAHLVGSTDSRAFRLKDPMQARIAGGIDAYVAQLRPDGALVSSSYLGGAEAERANAVAVDLAGRVHVAGRTLSANFPTATALQGQLSGDIDMFVTVIR
jgi:hypothetical protein